MEGEHLALALRHHGLSCKVLRGPAPAEFLNRQLVHFGSAGLFSNGGYRLVNPSNRIAVSFYHGDPSDPEFTPIVETFLAEQERVDRVIVSCRIMRDRMADWGVPPGKLVSVPIGVNCTLFGIPSPEERKAARERFGVTSEQVVVGSFQKDGVGWGEGLEPKLIKGPDVFLDTVASLRESMSLFVLLTGPSRGYVRRGLEQLGVPYHHEFVQDYADLVDFYHALDLYLVTSREEGGPKAVMESMATGVPLVTTRVGMAPDLVRDGENGFLCEVEDVERLAGCAKRVVSDKELRRTFAENSRGTALSCDFRAVAETLYTRVYRPLLATLSGKHYKEESAR